jgi:glycosyltransferase involved in cell wall biosynthesis
MRILYFHQHFTTPEGSAGTRSYEFARALVQRGHHVTMVCGRNERSAFTLPFDPVRGCYYGMVEGIELIGLPLGYSNRDNVAKRSLIFLRFAMRSAMIARASNHDVLFATSTPLTAAVPGIVGKLFRRGRPFIFEVRDLWPELPRALGMKNPILLLGMSTLESLAYRCADAIIALAPGIAQGVINRSASGKRVEMIPNGCDLDLFHPANRRPLELPGIAAGDFVAGFTGAHGRANGLDALLNVALELKRRGNNRIKFALFGEGSCKDALVARAHAEGLDNCLFFASVRKTEIARITASFDCGLQILANLRPFYYGTSPNKFFDYISAGIPVLNNYPGWLADLINEHHCGIAVPPDNAVAFADALCRLAADPVETKRMGMRARQLAESKFSRRQMSNAFCDLIEHVYE